MNYEEFCEIIKSLIQSSLGDEYNVTLAKTDKINGVTLHSIVILELGASMSPNIYLEPYYQKYQSGEQLQSIRDSIISRYNTINKYPKIPLDLLSDYPSAKDRLYYKLINYEKNSSYLSEVPHIKWLDLALVFCILVKKDTDGIGSITVKNDLMERWEVTISDLYEAALKSTPVLFEATVKSMDDIIQNMVLKQLPAFDEKDCFDDITADILQLNNTDNLKPPMYVAGNKSGINGATWLLQKDELRILSKKLSCNLFILPSSVHEVIVVPFTECISQDALYRMVQEVNATQVAPEEFLSNNVYFYSQEDDTLLPLY